MKSISKRLRQELLSSCKGRVVISERLLQSFVIVSSMAIRFSDDPGFSDDPEFPDVPSASSPGHCSILSSSSSASSTSVL
jgi:hypothetical protein